MGAYDINEAAVRIRALQAMFAVEHAALRNWGAWAADLAGIYPSISRPHLWEQFDRRGADKDGWGVEQEPQVKESPVKAEPAEKRAYDEKLAVMLDERMHSPGGLPDYVRLAIRTAYVSHEVPDDQFPRLSGCTLDAFCERLEGALRFVGRFA